MVQEARWRMGRERRVCECVCETVCECVCVCVCVCKIERESDRATVVDGEGRESESRKPVGEEE